MKIEINKNVFKRFPQLESERLLFRQILKSDSKDLYLIRSNDDVMRYMDINKTESINDAEKLILTLQDSYEACNSINWGIIEKTSKSFIGYFGFWRMIHQHCRAEIAYALYPTYWGNGFMAETLKTLLYYGFKNINLHSIEANVNPANNNSIKLLEKIGFKKEAHFKENYLFNNIFYDSFIYSLLEKDL